MTSERHLFLIITFSLQQSSQRRISFYRTQVEDAIEKLYDSFIVSIDDSSSENESEENEEEFDID